MIIRNEISSYVKPFIAVVRNLLLVYVAFMLCRLEFLAENWKYFSEDMTTDLFASIVKGGLLFDTSAILYINTLYIVLVLFPIHLKDTAAYSAVAKWVFIVPNTLAVCANLADSVYFQYTSRRTTALVFSEFSNESNFASIFFEELFSHWYLVLMAIILSFAFWAFYCCYRSKAHYSILPYYLSQLLSLALAVGLSVAGIRGGFTTAVRPITLSNANQFVNRPIETALVLNTPFSIFRTIGKEVFTVQEYFTDRNLMESLYSPVHIPSGDSVFVPKNVVVLIMESFGKEYSGLANRELKGEDYGFTPFLDSLAQQGLVFRHSFANGRKSIDAMPSILSGIPMFIEPFFLTPSSLNRVSGIAGELRGKGYSTAFFHGAENSSMGFHAYARASGFSNYYGRNEYPNGGDFDGVWAIWDKQFFSYAAKVLDTTQQPFVASLFSASSHHPFKLPKGEESKYKEGTLPIHKCIMYSDDALRQFFEEASRMEWYANTLFVVTADHTSQSNTLEYLTDAGVFSVPIIFYSPSDPTLTGLREGIAQQIDIMPTVLGYLGYDKPFVAFGCDLLNTPADEMFAINYINGIYQYFEGNYLLQFDGEKILALYDFVNDPLLKSNVARAFPYMAKQMENKLKSIIQQYMERMTQDALVL